MFKVYRDIIDKNLIDELLKSHKSFKKSFFSFFRAQGTNSFERPMLDKFNNQINSIQNPHLLGFSRKFRKASENIIFNQQISNCLRDFSGIDSFIQYQSMFFDKSTGTKLHQDTWYLDTSPKGKLVGVWIALENIQIESGPFCVYDSKLNFPIESEKYNFEDLDNDAKFNKDFADAKKYNFLAKKGDILIWDSFTIHGANKPLAPNLTRKSLTAHYYPTGSKIQSEPVKRLFSIYNHKKVKRTKNKNIYKAAIVNPYFYSLIILLLCFLSPLKKILMRDKKLKENHGNLVEIRRINND